MVIPRRESNIGLASANAAGMMGLLSVKNEEEMLEWHKLGAKYLLEGFGLPTTAGRAEHGEVS
jgi:hypothetical protein